jgi:hypothetical protein
MDYEIGKKLDEIIQSQIELATSLEENNNLLKNLLEEFEEEDKEDFQQELEQQEQAEPEPQRVGRPKLQPIVQHRPIVNPQVQPVKPKRVEREFEDLDEDEEKLFED